MKRMLPLIGMCTVLLTGCTDTGATVGDVIERANGGVVEVKEKADQAVTGIKDTVENVHNGVKQVQSGAKLIQEGIDAVKKGVSNQ